MYRCTSHLGREQLTFTVYAAGYPPPSGGLVGGGIGVQGGSDCRTAQLDRKIKWMYNYVQYEYTILCLYNSSQ